MNFGPPRKASAGAMNVTMASGMRTIAFFALRSGPASISATRTEGSSRQPVGKDAARRPGADDDVVELNQDLNVLVLRQDDEIADGDIGRTR